MKLLLNKNALQSNVWLSAIDYFKNVCDTFEIIPFSDIPPQKSIFQKIQYTVEVRFAGKINYKESIFDKLIDHFTTKIVLNLSGCDVGKIIEEYPDHEIWAIEYEGRNISYYETIGIGVNEIAHHGENIRVDLVKYIDDKKKCLIESAFYNPHYSAYRNFKKMLSTMPRLFIRSLNSESKSQILCEETQLVKQSYIKYLTCFYWKIFKKYWTVLTNRFFGYYDERWTMAIGEGSILNDGLSKMHIQPMPDNEFWAQFNSSVGDHHVTTAEYSTQTIHIS